MATCAKPMRQSPQPAWPTCHGSSRPALGVLVVCTRAKRSQFSAPPGGTEPERRETSSECAKRTQFSPGTSRDGSRHGGRSSPAANETNPVRPDGPPEPPQGPTVQTNPISESGPAGLVADHAKQSQTWAGWDIWGSRTSAADCAKQSQFPAARIPYHPTVLSFHHPSPRLIVRNKPNFRHRRVGRDKKGVGRGANAPNEPNSSSQPGPPRTRCAKRTQSGQAAGGSQRTKDAKRSQCAVRQRRQDHGRSQPCKTNPIPPTGRGPGGRDVQNEPNFRWVQRGSDGSTPAPRPSGLRPSSSLLFVAHPSQQWGCWRIDEGNMGSILSGDFIR
jgi:hypothetical protein